jgi:Ca-activated chloride channel family protein
VKARLQSLAAVAMALLFALPVPALPQGDAPARIKTRSELVVVPVTAKDRHGNLVSDLRREEFRILEDGVEQQIALFSADSFPLSAVVLIDNDLPLKTADEVQKSLMAIAAGFSSSDEVALMMYDLFPQTVLDFTPDNDKVFTQLKRMRLGSDFPGQGSGPMTAGPLVNRQSDQPKVPTAGVTLSPSASVNLTDAMYAAGQLLKSRGRDRRKIIFLISDGSDSRHNTMSYEDTIQVLLSADISVYAVAVGPALLKHGSSLLVKYANATGGDFYYVSKQEDLEKLYTKMTEEARTQYTLAYMPLNPDRSKDYHSIEVRVKRLNLDLLARQGYFTAAPH